MKKKNRVWRHFKPGGPKVNPKDFANMPKQTGIIFGNVEDTGRAINSQGGVDVLVFALNCEMTVTDLIDMMRQWRATKNGIKVELTVGGWDSDPRELYQIPQCVNLFKRMAQVGFFTIIKDGTPDDKTFLNCGVGSLQVWLWMNGQAQAKDYSVSEYAAFMTEQKERFEANCTASDGQNRSGGKLPE